MWKTKNYFERLAISEVLLSHLYSCCSPPTPTNGLAEFDEPKANNKGENGKRFLATNDER